jgi:regulation of enolase protein 1 (concanavalin A-like superfamily)
MPFLAAASSASSSASFFADGDIQRTLGPGTDRWSAQAGLLSWTHYTPSWKMLQLNTATTLEKKRFFLPATWMVFTVNNTTSSAKDFYFGLPANASAQTFSGGAYEGFVSGEAAFAIRAGAAELLSGTALTAALSGMSTGFAFHLQVPPGQSRSLTVAVAYYRNGVVDTRVNASYYYKKLFGGLDDVVDFAMGLLPDVLTRCQQLSDAMSGAGLNVYRQFLASDALHSYQASTLCLADPAGGIYWRELEGDYQYINTFDLTVDHAFYDSVMHPWALGNVLDTYAGVATTDGPYTYDHPLYNPSTQAQVSATGFSFHHDMGQGLTTAAPDKDPTSYESSFSYMSQEQLQNYILCAGLYWKRSGDNAWLTSHAPLLANCFQSMLLRDDVNAGSRDGITSFINMRDSTHKEITTYDSLDASLRQPDQSGRTTVRSWSAYLAFQAMFTQLGDTTNATAAGNMAALCASTIASKWNTYRSSPGYIPAFLDGSNTAATIPTIEGLAFPQQMGLTSAVSLSGPYATMLQDLKNHMTNILVSGRCLDSTSGAWKLTTGSTNTWQSKVYLCQFIAEKVLGMTGNTVTGTVDQIHATIQLQEAPTQGWSDQLNSTGSVLATQSLHYPRGITSSLWWLSPETNPDFPSPSAAPLAPGAVTARGENGRVILNWDSPGLATSFTVQRAISAGGPYTTLATDVTGASFIDYSVTASGTYYYTVSAVNAQGTGSPSSPVAIPVTAGQLPAFWSGMDIGATGVAGGENFSRAGNAFGLVASGSDIYGTADGFHFVSIAASGDLKIIARVSTLQNTDPSAKAGVMIRESAAAGSINAAVVVTPGHGVSLQWRSSTDGSTSSASNGASLLAAPCYVMLTRSGNTFSGYQSSDGQTWSAVGSATIGMASNVLLGVAATSHNNAVTTRAMIDNVLLSVLPSGWSAQDIGAPALTGSTYYSPDGSFTVTGAGADISGSSDSFQYAYRSFNGSFTVITRVEAVTNTNEWAKAGLMVRSSTAAGAPNVAVVITPLRGVSMQWRTTTGGGTTYTPNPYVGGITAPYLLRLDRKGNVFTTSRSADGVAWTALSSTTVSMGTTVLVGLAVTSHNTGQLNTSVLGDIAIVSAATQAWREAHFSAADLADPSKEATVWGDLADPDGDQAINLEEFGENGDPGSAASVPHPAIAVSGNQLTMRYTRLKAAMADLSFQSQGAKSLAGPWSSTGVTEQILSDDGTVQDVLASTPMDGDSKFLRLKISR